MDSQVGLLPRKSSSDQVTFRVSGKSFKMPFLIIYMKESRSAHYGNTIPDLPGVAVQAFNIQQSGGRRGRISAS